MLLKPAEFPCFKEIAVSRVMFWLAYFYVILCCSLPIWTIMYTRHLSIICLQRTCNTDRHRPEMPQSWSKVHGRFISSFLFRVGRCKVVKAFEIRNPLKTQSRPQILIELHRPSVEFLNTGFPVKLKTWLLLLQFHELQCPNLPFGCIAELAVVSAHWFCTLLSGWL